MRLSLPPFNPEAQHIATRPLTLAGRHIKPGQVIPSSIEPRRVRQLYETRRVSAAPEPTSEATEPKAPKRRAAK